MVYKKHLSTLTILLLIGTLGVLNFEFKKPKLSISNAKQAINFSPLFIKLFNLGNQRLYSSILWVHTLLVSDINHYKNDDLLSWMYLRFNAITDLDPKFYKAYNWGGQYLSIVKDDIFGAEALYLKGIEQFPNDFWLKFHTAFNYYFEIGDKEKGIKYYKMIQDHPDAKKNVPSLPSQIANMLAKQGSLDMAFKLLEASYLATSEPALRSHFEYLLYSIKAKIDLECLNKGKVNCHQKDYRENTYIVKNGKYEAQSSWKNFSPKKIRRRKINTK